MKRLVLLLVLLSVSAQAGQVWNVIPDFPKSNPFPTSSPINGWTWGYHCVQAPTWSLTPNTDYQFNTFVDANTASGYYILRRDSSSNTTPDVRVNLRTTLGSNGIRPYGSAGCVAMRPHYDLAGEGSSDDRIVDSFVQWQAPASGFYDLNMGVFFTTGNNEVEVTISINGVAVEGVNGVLSSSQPSYTAIGKHLASGDIVKMYLRGLHTGSNMTPIYAEIAQTAEPACWNVKKDFPNDATFVYPHHGWTLGSKCVKTNWTGITNGNSYDYHLFVNNGSDYILRGPSASYAPEARLTSFATVPGFQLKTRLQTNSSSVVTNDFTSYLKWTAPVSGSYTIQLNANSTSQNAKVTFSINDKAINDINDANTLNANAGVSLFAYSLNAGDILKIEAENDYSLIAANINYQTAVNVSAEIRLNADSKIVEDFEDGDISDWTISDPEVSLTSAVTHSGTYALAATRGSNVSANVHRKFFDRDVNNVEITVQFYKESGSHESEGTYFRLNSTDGTYILTRVGGGNHITFSTDQKPSSTGWQKPDYVLYNNISPAEGWNEFKAVFDANSDVRIYVNDLFITRYSGTAGLSELELGIAYDPCNAAPVFDDIVIARATDTDYACKLSDDIIHQAGDLDNDCKVDAGDLFILANHWLEDAGGSSPTGIFDSMEYHNFATAANNGWSTFQGVGIITDEISRSGNESIMIPKGAFGRIGKMFNNYPVNCTVSAWVYLPSVDDRDATEVDILDSDYSPTNYIRVSALNSSSGSLVKTAIGSGAWTNSSVSVIDGWNKVSFVVTSTGTNIYFNNTLLRNVSAATFNNFKLLSIGKGGWHDAECPVDGEVIFDDVSVFASVNIAGQANAVFSEYEADNKAGINFADFSVIASEWNLDASINSSNAAPDNKQYVVANFADTGGTPINQESFDEFVRKLPNDITMSRNSAISRGFRCIDNDPCNAAERQTIISQLQNFMNFSEAYNIPIVIHFDMEQWWGNRPDLWNWWDSSGEGYNPANADNVEWYGWNSSYATKVSWRNWGTQTRRAPAPNLMSPVFRQQCHIILDTYVPMIVNWYNSLPNYKKHLLLGFKLGGETTIGINAYYYPNGNYYIETWPDDSSHDPVFGINGNMPPNYGVQQIGYAALKDSGLKTSGTITETDIARVVGMHLSDLAQRAYNLGIPKEKLFTSCWRFAGSGTNTYAAVNSYSGPGWSYYATNPQEKMSQASDIAAAIANRTSSSWAINEGYFNGVQTTANWETWLKGNMEQRCRYINLFNWHAYRNNEDVLLGIKNSLKN
jgi:hypothetical protein